MTKEELMDKGASEALAELIEEETKSLCMEYENKIKSIQLENAIETALSESGAKNKRVVRALLDTEGDIKEQIESLKNDSETRFLFEAKHFTPYKSAAKLPDGEKDEFEARLKDAREKGNTLEAIRIKQQASIKGIMLI